MACRRTNRSAAAPCSKPLRNTSITPRLPISLLNRARNFSRVDVFRVLVIDHAEFLECFRLGGLQELEKLRHIERVGAVVVFRISGEPAAAGGFLRRDCVRRFRGDAIGCEDQPIRAGHVLHDQRLQSLLADVGAHASCSSSMSSASSLSSETDVAGSSACAGRSRAAVRTSSLPVTTSATSRVRYSRSNSISRSAASMDEFAV